MTEPISTPTASEQDPSAIGILARPSGAPLSPAGKLPGGEAEWRPTAPPSDTLIFDDGIPMDSPRHRSQMNLLIETLKMQWAGRSDFYTGGNMFVYFSPDQVKNEDYRGPDFFVALDVDGGPERKGWVVWEEGKGPDVVIELLSESTADFDKNEKMRIYESRLRVPEYYWYDPIGGELAGFELRGGRYHPLAADQQGRIVSPLLGLRLTRWTGKYDDIQATWLRWETLDGKLAPTRDEYAQRETERAEQERERAAQAEERAAQAEGLAAQERERAAQAEGLAAQERERAERLAAQLRALGIDPAK
ncbi:MAG: Uma2 family endonuclease [Blastocatellia bacterium]